MTNLSKTKQERFWNLWRQSGASSALHTYPTIWEEQSNGNICIKKVDTTFTSLWCNGWYKNPSSGRSHNYGISTEKRNKHQTVIVKGGSFFVDEKFKEAFIENELSLSELYGGISFEMAQREMQVAMLIQEKFKCLLGKKANCPQPLGIKVIENITHENGEMMTILNYFKSIFRMESAKKSFTAANFLKIAQKLSIDLYYPMSETADESDKKDPFGWIFTQCLEKTKQSVYSYMIDGPNTRLLDLMTQNLPERRRYFIEANNALNITSAVEAFSSKLGEFYGLLHKSNIGYHGGSSEHCTLIDITVAGTVMDIGGLSEDTRIEENLGRYAEEYAVEMWKATNLITYLCNNILKISNDILKCALNAFWNKYKSLYSDQNVEYCSKEENMDLIPWPIRTRYFDNISGGWIQIASDLQEQKLALVE